MSIVAYTYIQEDKYIVADSKSISENRFPRANMDSFCRPTCMKLKEPQPLWRKKTPKTQEEKHWNCIGQKSRA